MLAIPSCEILRQLYWLINRKYYSLPPGPNGLPFLGFVFTWHSNTTARTDLSNKYGPIFYTQYFGMPMIVISSSKLMKQIFTKKEFLNRPKYFNKDTDYHHSIQSTGKSQTLPLSLANGENWGKRRKVSQGLYIYNPL